MSHIIPSFVVTHENGAWRTTIVAAEVPDWCRHAGFTNKLGFCLSDDAEDSLGLALKWWHANRDRIEQEHSAKHREAAKVSDGFIVPAANGPAGTVWMMHLQSGHRLRAPQDQEQAAYAKGYRRAGPKMSLAELQEQEKNVWR